MLPFAIVTISLALIFYSIGVWGEKLAGRLSWFHLTFFWVGFVFDTTGTTLMGDIAGGFAPNIHGITGVLALILMAIHAVWATVVLVRRSEKWIQRFHSLSIVVWGIWLVPYGIGMALNMKF